MAQSSGGIETQMVNWKQRELERARNAAMVREQQLRELRTKAGADERAAHDGHEEHGSGPIRRGKHDR
jgi:hypothetical protein